MSEIAPNYVNEFNCLGSDCIDTCCQGWNINIDKNTHEKYQKLELEGISKDGQEDQYTSLESRLFSRDPYKPVCKF